MEIRTPSPKPEEVIVYTFVSTTGQRHSIDVYPEQGDTVEPVIEANSLVFHRPRLHETETINTANLWRSMVEKQSRLYVDPKDMKAQILEFLKNEQTKRPAETLPAPVVEEETTPQQKRPRKTRK